MPQNEKPLCLAPPVALTIAGSDNSAGAGLQADLKTFTHYDVYGLTVVTCVVAEVPGRVVSIQAIDVAVVRDQLNLSLEYFPVAAIKTGMLFSEKIIDTVCTILEGIPPVQRPFLVVDPVMVATSGDSLLEAGAIARYQERLFPLADLVTPNLDEAEALLGKKIDSLEKMSTAAEELFSRFGVAFLVKGGHLPLDMATDLLRDSNGACSFSAPYHHGISTHGTGCRYSAAIAANLALGQDLRSSIDAAKIYIDKDLASTRNPCTFPKTTSTSPPPGFRVGFRVDAKSYAES